MSDRERVLAALRNHRLEAGELPGPDGEWIEYADRLGQFVEVLEGVGGQARHCANHEAAGALAALPEFQQAERICSLVPEIAPTNVDLTAMADPHALADLDFAVLPGELAVAENAAVWVDTAKLPHRVVPFLTQHLALVVAEHRICDNLHQAYQALEFRSSEFGVFISGPSKTADIEQSLVIGAHGARSLTVLLLGNGDQR